MKNIYFLLFALSILIAGCEPYETQFEGPYEDGDDTTPEEEPELFDHEILFVEKNQLKMIDRELLDVKRNFRQSAIFKYYPCIYQL